MADPSADTTWITCSDLAFGCAVCSDYACDCEEVFGVTLTEEQEGHLWFWISSQDGRGET